MNMLDCAKMLAPATTPCWAMYKSQDAPVVFKQVMCWAFIQGYNTVVGLVTDGPNLQPASALAGFLCYANAEERQEVLEKCLNVKHSGPDSGGARRRWN